MTAACLEAGKVQRRGQVQQRAEVIQRSARSGRRQLRGGGERVVPPPLEEQIQEGGGEPLPALRREVVLPDAGQRSGERQPELDNAYRAPSAAAPPQCYRGATVMLVASNRTQVRRNTTWTKVAFDARP